MKWLNKEFADALSEEIKKYIPSIVNRTHTNYGVVEDIVINEKKYLMRYDRNFGVHYYFEIYDGDEIIAKGDFPAVEVDEEFRKIRFYSNQNATLFEYELQ